MNPAPALGTVISLERFPVKSLAGETLDSATVDARGLSGDRTWALREPDGRLGSGKSTRRFSKMDGLMLLRARYDGQVPVIAFPDGSTVRADAEDADARMSDYVGRPVALTVEGSVPHHDQSALHLVTTSSLRSAAVLSGSPVDARHTRANLVIDTGEAPGFDEAQWTGRTLQIGHELVVTVEEPMQRCVMVGMAQAGLDARPGLLRQLTDTNGACLGLALGVLRPGRVSLGDLVHEVTQA